MGAKFLDENKDSVATCTEFAQSRNQSPNRRVRSPVTIEFYDQRAKVHEPAKNLPFHRVVLKGAAKRRMLTFGRNGKGNKASEEMVKELHKGKQSFPLPAKPAQDALTVHDMPAIYRQETGMPVSIKEWNGNHLSAVKQLPKGCPRRDCPCVSPEHLTVVHEVVAVNFS